jgi:hypothetical protein
VHKCADTVLRNESADTVLRNEGRSRHLRRFPFEQAGVPNGLPRVAYDYECSRPRSFLNAVSVPASWKMLVLLESIGTMILAAPINRPVPLPSPCRIGSCTVTGHRENIIAAFGLSSRNMPVLLASIKIILFDTRRCRFKTGAAAEPRPSHCLSRVGSDRARSRAFVDTYLLSTCHRRETGWRCWPPSGSSHGCVLERRTRSSASPVSLRPPDAIQARIEKKPGTGLLENILHASPILGRLLVPPWGRRSDDDFRVPVPAAANGKAWIPESVDGAVRFAPTGQYRRAGSS